jgi:hypothetical protein
VSALLEKITKIDADQQEVRSAGTGYPYHYLVLAHRGAARPSLAMGTGSQYTVGLKTLDDAQAIRRPVLSALEHGERSHDGTLHRRLMTIVFAGAESTGVELGRKNDVTSTILVPSGREGHARPERGREIALLSGLECRLCEKFHKVLASLSPFGAYSGGINR